MKRDLGFDFCRTPSDKNPFVAGPLKRSDCSLVSDGAAALVLSMEPLPGAAVPAVRWRSRTQVNEFLPLSRRDPTRFEGAALAWQRGLAGAGLTLDDLQFVETHDCFTVAELLGVRGHGPGAARQGARVILEGITRKDGRLPVNPSGGLKSRGHPIGATGVSQHVIGGDCSCPARRAQCRSRAARARVPSSHGRRRSGKLPERAGGDAMNSAQVCNLARLLTHTAQLFPDRPGLIQGDRQWTWAQIDQDVNALVAALQSLGVRQGERILLQSRNNLTMFVSAGPPSAWAASGCRPISA